MIVNVMFVGSLFLSSTSLCFHGSGKAYVFKSVNNDALYGDSEHSTHRESCCLSVFDIRVVTRAQHGITTSDWSKFINTISQRTRLE